MTTTYYQDLLEDINHLTTALQRVKNKNPQTKLVLALTTSHQSSVTNET